MQLNKNKVIIFLIFTIALTVRLWQLSLHHDTKHFTGLTYTQGAIGYNLTQGRPFTIELNHQLQILKKDRKEQRLVSPNEVEPSENPIFLPPATNDTPFYGTFLGIIWLLTSNSDYIYIQYLQAILSATMVFFIYGIGAQLFNKRTGFISAILFALLIPEAHLSIFPLRDIWGGFANIIFLYFLVKAIKTTNYKSQQKNILIGTIIFSLLSLFRPNIVFVILLFIPFTLFFWKFKTTFKHAILMLSTTIILFWTPLISFNYHTYGRAMVGPFGQGLITSIGEFENPFGLELKDEITKKVVKDAGYNYKYGTPEFDDVLKDVAKKYIKERPDIYIKNIIKRIPRYLKTSNHPPQLTKINLIANIKSLLWNLLFGINPLIHIIILFFALILTRKQKTTSKAIIICTLIPLYSFLIWLPFHFEPRYIIISMPPLIIIKAFMFDRMIPIITKKIKSISHSFNIQPTNSIT